MKTENQNNIFQVYLEFKFLKSKIAYSCLILLIFPILDIVFDSPFSFQNFTFVNFYKLVFVTSIIGYFLYLLVHDTKKECSAIINYLDLDTDQSLSNDKDDNNLENKDENNDHYLIVKD